MDDTPSLSKRWRQWRHEVDLDEYETRWERLESEGQNVHGEADFVARYANQRILDGGCGMGRIGVELSRRGYDVVGVDNDPDMLDRAQKQDSPATWLLDDLTRCSFEERFDTIVLAGNVLVFVEPTRRHLAVPNLVAALEDGGYLISGSSFSPPFDITGYDDWCYHAGLKLVERYGSWDRSPFRESGHYAVSVHRLLNQHERRD